MSEDIPEPWRSACESKGISPTYRPLASAAGLAHETVRKVIQGRNTTRRSIAKVADALGVDVELIYEWRSEAVPDFGRDLRADESASLLTTEEREAVNGLIRLLTRDRQSREEVVGNAEHPAPTSTAGATPVEEPMSDPDGYVLAARDVDDDEESEAQQEQP